MSTDKIIIQTNIVVQFTSRSLPPLGENPGHLVWCLPQVVVCHQLSTNCILSSQIQHDCQYAFFSQGSGQWRKDFLSLRGCLDICPQLHQFHVTSITQSELSSLSSLKTWGNAEEFCSDITFLLVSTEEEATGDRMYGLSTVLVNPYQARVSTVGEAVGELTALASSGPIWPYGLGAAQWGHLPCATS